MCGIAGFLGRGDDATLASMCDALSRRGPDDRGLYTGGGIGLSQRRLAVIDLSPGGHQPMESVSGKTVVTFNGEIYNYKQIRDELKGVYEFRTESDTEVILALYEQLGVAGFSKLDGMFAIALYDTVSETLYLVRDRFGKKPLYWGIFDGTILFGSELKALMRHPSFKKEIDPTSLELYLAYEYVPTPRSIFKGVRKMEPASFLTFKAGAEPVVRSYWTPPVAASLDPYEVALERTDTLLNAAVAKRLVSDVPLGVFLSGGIDSSTVAYYAKQHGEVRTFSIGFDDPDFDESSFARDVASVLGTIHSEERFSSKTCVDIVPEVFAYVDEPMADASILPTYLLSGFTRKHVTVALGGDGGDELFAGYPTFQAEALVGAYRAIPDAVRSRVVEPLIRALPSSDTNMSFDFKLKRFIEGAGYPDHERHQRWLGAFTDDAERSSLLRQPTTVHPYDAQKGYFEGVTDRGAYLNRLLWSYARTYMMDEVLVKVDRASMAHGLEARTPFLDTALSEYVLTLPYEYKYKRFTGKRLLKSVMRGKLPTAIIDRPKKGFGIPLARWLRTDMNALMHTLLSEDALTKSGLFQPDRIRVLMEEHESGAADHRKKLWTLMVFQMWFQKWYV